MSPSPRLAVCVASNRGPQVREFLEAWAPHLAARGSVDVFIHEDGPTRSFVLPAHEGVRLTHSSHAEIDGALGRQGWIIPRKSGASRSFPMLLAWRAGAEFILTMDDDCLPPEERSTSYFDDHLGAFALDRWFRTIDGETPRGVPYGDKGKLPVLLNHGVWTGVPDLDGPTALVAGRRPAAVILRAAREVVPPGIYFPLCAMNVCYAREAIPAAYNLLMGLEEAGFDRFDDIWSGLFLKRIADHLGFYVTNGLPFVRHTKASNLFANLRKEALGIHLHEEFWKHIAEAPLEGAKTVVESYLALARWVAQFPQRRPEAPSPKGYFEKLSEAMTAWAGLFMGKAGT